MSRPLLEVNNLKKYFLVRRGLFGATAGLVHAVDGVSFHINRSETLSLVGESGCGKSTVGKAVLRLFDITAGQVILDGQRIDDLAAATLRPMRRRVQVVFQDPFSSLNPRLRVRDILAEPIRNFALAKSTADLNNRVHGLLDRVGLPRDAATRFPHEFSGGQRQRIGIARALAAEPDLIVCDEAVSALDVSVKAQIVNLLQQLQQQLGLALLFISHDLAIVEHMTHRVAVMYLGKLCEVAPTEELYAAPAHPYTALLLEAIPQPDPDAPVPTGVGIGEPPSPMAPPSGCRFRTRCSRATARCSNEEPVLAEVAPGRFAACHFPLIAADRTTVLAQTG